MVASRVAGPEEMESVCTPNLSVVMPCLNEAETLRQCIREAQEAVAGTGITAEIVVADNGSDDGSQAIAEECRTRVICVPERGYGSALRAGIAAARGEYVIMGDADASYDFGEIPRFLAALREGHDLVIGNRYAGGIAPGAMPWKHKYIGNPALSKIGRLFFACPVSDMHCGLRAFRKDAIEKLPLSCNGMEFASELIVKATVHGLRIIEIPTSLRKDGRSRPPHLRSWRDGWRHLRFLLLYCPSWLFVVPSLVMILIGAFMLTAFAVFGPIRIGEVTLSINTAIVCAMSILIGNQLLLMGIFAQRVGSLVGIWPRRDRLAITARWFSLELGLAISGFLVLAGLSGIAHAITGWLLNEMGPLDSSIALRQVLPSTTLLMLGVQGIFGSFFLSLQGLIRLPANTACSQQENNAWRDLKDRLS